MAGAGAGLVWCWSIVIMSSERSILPTRHSATASATMHKKTSNSINNKIAFVETTLLVSDGGCDETYISFRPLTLLLDSTSCSRCASFLIILKRR